MHSYFCAKLSVNSSTLMSLTCMFWSTLSITPCRYLPFLFELTSELQYHDGKQTKTLAQVKQRIMKIFISLISSSKQYQRVEQSRTRLINSLVVTGITAFTFISQSFRRMVPEKYFSGFSTGKWQWRFPFVWTNGFSGGKVNWTGFSNVSD